MNFLESIKGRTHFKIKVKTGKPKTQLIDIFDDVIFMDVKAQPIDGKANIEIIKYFKKTHKLSVEIVSGKTSKEKLVKIIY